MVIIIDMMLYGHDGNDDDDEEEGGGNDDYDADNDACDCGLYSVARDHHG